MANESRNDNLRDRTKAYASRIIRLYTYLQKEHHYTDAALIIGKQLLRSGTSVAANHREAKYARSKADKIAKLHIVLQELEESALWIELLLEHKMASLEGLQQILSETNQLIGIFVASIKTIERHVSEQQ
ncbi:MAG: four helix bundle protein [Chloroflexaceae bacterium]|nr:four helix bundle protein [Chloroflexaceae bacterium]